MELPEPTERLSTETETRHGPDVTDALMVSLDSSLPQTYSEVINVVVSSIGILANAFTILVLLHHKKLRQRTGNWLLVNQSVLDFFASFMFGAYHLYILLVENMFMPPYLGIAGDLFCRLWANGLWCWVLVGASAYNLIGITLERYMMVVRPLHHKVRMTERYVAVMCLFPWLLSSLYLGSALAATYRLENGFCLVFFTLFSNKSLMYSASVLDMLVWLAIPVISILCMYARIVITLRSRVEPKSTVGGPASQSGHDMGKAQRNLTRTCAIVVVFFICMWCPNQMLLQVFAFGAKVNMNHYTLANKWALVLLNLNGCINPFIYAFSYTEFKNGIRGLFGYKTKT